MTSSPSRYITAAIVEPSGEIFGLDKSGRRKNAAEFGIPFTSTPASGRAPAALMWVMGTELQPAATRSADTAANRPRRTSASSCGPRTSASSCGPRTSASSCGSSDQRVVVRSSDQRVVVRSSDQRVVVRSSDQRVVVRSSDQRVVVRSSDQRVVVRSSDHNRLRGDPKWRTVHCCAGYYTPERPGKAQDDTFIASSALTDSWLAVNDGDPAEILLLGRGRRAR